MQPAVGIGLFSLCLHGCCSQMCLAIQGVRRQSITTVFSETPSCVDM